jgi:hypothetical protein
MTAEKIFKEVRFNHEPSADLWLRLGEMCKQEGWRLSVSADMGDEGFRLRLREFIQDPKRLSAMAEYLECGYREIWSWAEGCLPHQLIRMQAESFMGRP